MKADSLKIPDKALFDVVLNTVSDAIRVIDKDLKVLFQNEAVQQIYGTHLGKKCIYGQRLSMKWEKVAEVGLC